MPESRATAAGGRSGRPAGRPQRVSSRDLAEFVVAQGELLRAQLHAWVRPTGSLVRPTGREWTPAVALQRGTRGRAETAVVVQRSVRAIDRAARRGLFRPACLVRSVALVRLLERRGVKGGTIRLGVRHGEAALDAHAWIEIDGHVVGDDPRHTGSFTPIGSVAVVDTR